MKLVRAARTVALVAVPALALAASCSPEGTDPPRTTGEVEYHEQIRPILEANCVTCHHAGGPAPFSLEYQPEQWKGSTPEWADSAVAAVADGRMPPWLPGADCKDLAFARVLTDGEKATLAAWRDEGFPEGDPAEYEAPGAGEAPPALGEPTKVVEPASAYTPSTELSDDYRCFLLPTEITEETYLVASGVVPGVQAMVHHALIYLIAADGLAAIEKLDSEDETPGYECFGGPGGGALTTLGAWVPGSVVQRTPADAAFVLPAGSRLVLQIHYNTLALDGAAAPADLSTVRLWTTPDKPASRVENLPMAHLGMQIPAGDEASVQERVFKMPVDGKIVGIAPHMHLLGSSIDVAFEPAGAEPACLVDIPRWDFHWQQSYPFPAAGFMDAKKGDDLRVRCTYDNSAANQPIVAGTKQVPRDVTWGEGTLDEMCLAYVATMVPYDAPDFRCGAYPECVAGCATGDAACFFDCATVGGGQCAGCLIQAVAKCAPPYCASTGLALQSCAKSCEDPGPGCLAYECAEPFDAFYGCMEPHLENGDCQGQLAACGL